MNQFLLEIPSTKRLLYTDLRKFIDDKNDYVPSIGIISGLRKTGKTTLLKQIAEDYISCKRIMYLNFRDNVVYSHPDDESLRGCTPEKVILKFLSGGYAKYDLLFLDEITALDNHEVISGNLYDISSGSGPGWRYKVLMTGSSPFHLRSLSSGSLGGGRSKLFRLPVLKFVEYLHIARGVLYDDYSTVTREDFIDYLVLKDLPPAVLGTFDRQYFVDFQRDIDIGDDMACHSRGYAGLDVEDLNDLAHVLAYQLAYRVGYRKFAKANVGKYELGLLGKDRKDFDLSRSLIHVSSENIARMKSDGVHKSIANLLHFLVGSDIVNVETELLSDGDAGLQPMRLLRYIKDLRSEQDFLTFFEKHSISMNSPLLYTRLGNDILSFVDLSLEKFFAILKTHANTLLGGLLEVYLRGGIAELDSLGLPYVSKKLHIRHDVEIDIINTDSSIMCETTVKNKDRNKVHVADYYKERDMLRICTTANLQGVRDCYYMFPWPVFCCMVDTGDVLRLYKTKSSDYLGDSQKKIT